MNAADKSFTITREEEETTPVAPAESTAPEAPQTGTAPAVSVTQQQGQIPANPNLPWDLLNPGESYEDAIAAGKTGPVENPFAIRREEKEKLLEREPNKDSALATAVLAIARGDKNVTKHYKGTAVERYGKQLANYWASGKNANVVFKNGKPTFEFDDKRQYVSVWQGVDKNGKPVKTSDPNHDRQNWADFGRTMASAADYLNGGVFNEDTSYRLRYNLGVFEEAFRYGFMDDEEFDSGDGSKIKASEWLYDYLEGLDELENMDATNRDIAFGNQAVDYLNELKDAFANGEDIDLDDVYLDWEDLQDYVRKYSKDEELGTFFKDLSDGYYLFYNKTSTEALTKQIEDLTRRQEEVGDKYGTASTNYNWASFTANDEESIKQFKDEMASTKADMDALGTQIDEAKAKKTKLEQDYRDYFSTKETRDAETRLAGGIGGYETAAYKQILEERGKIYDYGEVQTLAEQMMAEDRQFINNWADGIGVQTAKYTFGEGADTFLGSKLGTYKAEALNLASRLLRDIGSSMSSDDTGIVDFMDAGQTPFQPSDWVVKLGEEIEGTGVTWGEQALNWKVAADTDMNRLKDQLGAGGKFAVDLLSTTMDIGVDALSHAGLASMFARVYSDATMEAALRGATYDQQMYYGIVNAGVEVLTEKLSDGLGLIYGKGKATDIIESAIQKYASSDTGANFLRFLAGTNGEGIEEIISELISPFAEWIIDPEKRDERAYEVDGSDLLYSYLLGATSGAMGQIVERYGGGYAAANAEQKADMADQLAKMEQDANVRSEEDQEAFRQKHDELYSQLVGRLIPTDSGPLKGALYAGGTIFPAGYEGARSVTQGENRFDTATNVQVEGLEQAGYIPKNADQDANYAQARTGADERAPSAEGSSGKGPEYTDEEAPEESDRNTHFAEDEAEHEEAAGERDAKNDDTGRNFDSLDENEQPSPEPGPTTEDVEEGVQERREREEREEYLNSIGELADSQNETIKGQDVNPTPAPKSEEQRKAEAEEAAKAYQDEQDALRQVQADARKKAEQANAIGDYQGEQDALREAQQAKERAEELQKEHEAEVESQEETPLGQTEAIAGETVSTAASGSQVTTSTETAQGATSAPTQAQTPTSNQQTVKPAANSSQRVNTPEEGRAAIKNGSTNNKTVAEVVPMVDSYVSQAEPVSTIEKSIFKKTDVPGDPPLSTKVINWIREKFAATNGRVHSNPIGGDVLISKQGIKDDISHGVGNVKAATFEAIPDVLQNGVIVSRSDGTVKNASVTIAGKVMLMGKPVNVYCVVKTAPDGHSFYLHEVSDGNGTLYYQMGQKENAPSALQDSSQPKPVSADEASTASIAQEQPTSKSPADNATRSNILSTEDQQSSTIVAGQNKLSSDSEVTSNGNSRRALEGSTRSKGEEDTGRAPESSGTDGISYSISSHVRGAGAREAHEAQVKKYEKAGGRVIPKNEWTPVEVAADNFVRELGVSGITVIDAQGKTPYRNGSSLRNSPGAGIFVIRAGSGSNNTTVAAFCRTVLHETIHNKLATLRLNGDFKAKSRIEAAIKSKLSPVQYKNAIDAFKDLYAPSILGAPEHFAMFLQEDQEKWYAKQTPSNIGKLTERAEEELITHLFAGQRPEVFGSASFDDLVDTCIDAAIAELKLNTTRESVLEFIARGYDHNEVDSEIDDLPFKSRSVSPESNTRYSDIDSLVDAIVNNSISKEQARAEYERIKGEQQADKAFENFYDHYANIDKAAGEIQVNEDAQERNRLLQLAKEQIAGKSSTQPESAPAPQQQPAATESSQPAPTGQQQPAPVEQAPAEPQQAERKPNGPFPPGTNKKSQSAFEEDIATKGERNNTAEAAEGPEGTYTSRTNEARTLTAKQLTDTQEKADAQYKRIMGADAWTDEDLVIAQKLAFDMRLAIRDYQLNRPGKRKMKKEAFAKLTKEYNDLMLKHKKILSEAGQLLQANYVFTEGEKIIQRAAMTYLGFSSDGRFTGTSNPSAKNAKIYAGIEEAVRRVEAAVEAKNTEDVARICKDISKIRNVKKMFGPLSKFADSMESKQLTNLARTKDGLKTLETLTYGNINGMIDDVQPYKVLNAAKTIRVMNMLSNMATIMNNLGNNFGQSLMNRSLTNQLMTQLAAKPFEKLTGQSPISRAATNFEGRKAIHNAKVEALELATLMQMYGVATNNGRLELNDKGGFDPNVNAFEQTMAAYKFLIGMGVEATDQFQAAGLLKSMELGIDADIAAGRLAPEQKEQRMQEARHEVNRLLYKDDNELTSVVQHFRDFLNKKSIGNEKTGTIGIGDITMAFAKIPANVVKTRLLMTPEGCLYQVASYIRGVNKAKRMHAETLARGIAENTDYLNRIKEQQDALAEAYKMEKGSEKDDAIDEARRQLELIDSEMWAEASQKCSGSVYKNLRNISSNYGQNLTFIDSVERAGYNNATEMSSFEMAQNARKIGRAATSAGMVALGAVLRSLGALKDFDEEPDKDIRKMNSDKGYKGLMLNLSAIGRPGHEWKPNEDIIVGGDWLEVMALPLTIGATAAECAANAEDLKTWNFFKSVMGNGLGKAFESVEDLPGMGDALNFYNSFHNSYTTDTEKMWNNLGTGLLNYAANTVPSFFMPNAVTQVTAGLDNKVRNVYSADNAAQQAWNIFANKIPVLRNTVPVSVDVWGNERTYGDNRAMGVLNKWLFPGDIFKYKKNKYEEEIERLAHEGFTGAIPKTTVNSTFEVGGVEYTMNASEIRDYRMARNIEQGEFIKAFIDSEYYNMLNDNERESVFRSLKTMAERDAKQDLFNERGTPVELNRDKWETELGTVDKQIQFLTAKQLAGNLWDRDREDMDYAAIDRFIAGDFGRLDDEQKNLLLNSYSHFDDIDKARPYGIGSEMWQKGYDIYKDYNSKEGKDRVKGGYKDWEVSQMWNDIQKATRATPKQMEYFKNNMKLYNSNLAWNESFEKLQKSGWSDDAAQALVKSVADLQPTKGRKTVSYKQRITAVATSKGTDAQKWAAFYDYCPSSYTGIIRDMRKLQRQGKSFEEAWRKSGKWDP